MVSVLDYGADPTGVADSTAAFNLATMATTAHGGNDDVAIRRTVYVPPGDYKITGSVYIRNGQHLQGAGEGSSRIRLESTTDYTDHIFKMGLGLINGTPTTDAGGQPPEISELGTVGGPSTKCVVWGVAAGYRIHDMFLTSVGIGIGGLGESGTISSVQIDQAQTGFLVGGQSNTFTDIKLYWCNYAIRTDTGVCANQDFVNLQIYYPMYAGIEFSDGSLISGFTVTGGSFTMNGQYAGSMTGQVVLRSTNANNIMFSNVSFNNFYGPALATFADSSGSNIKFSDCVFDGLKTVAGFDQGTTAYAAYCAGNTLTFNDCTFKNLYQAPLYVNGHATVKTCVNVRGGEHANNGGASFVKFAATAPAALSSVTVEGLDVSGALNNTIFGSLNRSGWSLSTDALRPVRSQGPTPLGVAIAKTLAGVSDTRILFVGDSTTRGRGATPGTNGPVALLAKRLSALLSAPVIDNWITPEAQGNTDDSGRITLGAGWSGATGYGWGNRCVWLVSSGSTTLTLAYASGYSNKVRIYYTAYPTATGSFTPTVNSVALASQSMVGTAGIAVYEATYTRSATADVVITPSGGPVLITGIEFLDTTQKCVYLCNAGSTGSVVADWNAVNLYSTDKMLAAYAPHHTMLNLGINDSVLNSPTATWSASMATLIGTLQGYGAVDLWTFFETDPAQNYVATLQPQYYDEFGHLSASLGCEVIDLHAESGGFAYLNALGLMADIAHPTGAAYALVTPAIADRLLTFA